MKHLNWIQDRRIVAAAAVFLNVCILVGVGILGGWIPFPAGPEPQAETPAEGARSVRIKVVPPVEKTVPHDAETPETSVKTVRVEVAAPVEKPVQQD